MNLPSAVFAGRAVIRETLAQAKASGVVWGFLAVTIICTIFCLSVSVVGETPQLATQPHEAATLIPKTEAERLKLTPEQVRAEGVDVPTGKLRLFFGAFETNIQRSGEHSVRLVQLILAGGVADTAGVLLALLWTASFLPSFLDPKSAVSVFARPAPRWLLLVGKYFAVVVVVSCQAFLFIAMTWLALGFRTGAWNLNYFLAVPLLVLHFGVFFSISVLIAVWTRSAVACALGTLLVWGLCFAVNLARHENSAAITESTSAALESSYWLLPKPADFNLLLADALGAADYFRQAVDLRALFDRGRFAPELTLLTSIAFAAAALIFASRILRRTDY